jgi:GH15 family glucan-1,4-alpha-glucosidase
LEYLTRVWAEDTFDPWEEVKSQIFFAKICARRALLEGASLADALDDGGAAIYYRARARDIENNIDEVHWSQSRKIIMEIPS